jgi:2-methylcitrate dehydratase PrpD
MTPVIEAKARLLLLDSLGCILAGLAHPELHALARALAVPFPGTLALPGQAVPLGPAGFAALTAAAMCWDEACEGLAEAHGRPALPVVPVVLALGRRGTLGAALEALEAGYEAGARAGLAWRIRPGMHVDGSWHALGAAVAAARLLGCDAAAAAAAADHAACQMPFSLYLPIARGSSARNLYPAHAALLGVLAASGQAAGIAAPPDALAEARRLALGLEGAAPDAGDRAMILDAYIKPFAAVRHVHYGAAAALALPAMAPELITAIRLGTYEEGLRYCGNRAPGSAIAAQFSLSFGVAAALVLRDLGPEAYAGFGAGGGGDVIPPHAAIQRLECAVEITIDPTLSSRGAVLHVTAAGSTHSARAESVAGDPTTPMTTPQVVEKFRRYAGPDLGARTEALITALLDHPTGAPLPWP